MRFRCERGLEREGVGEVGGGLDVDLPVDRHVARAAPRRGGARRPRPASPRLPRGRRGRGRGPRPGRSARTSTCVRSGATCWSTNAAPSAERTIVRDAIWRAFQTGTSPAITRFQRRGSRYLVSTASPRYRFPAPVDIPNASASSATQNSATNGAPSPAIASSSSVPSTIAACRIDSTGCITAHSTAPGSSGSRLAWPRPCPHGQRRAPRSGESMDAVAGHGSTQALTADIETPKTLWLTGMWTNLEKISARLRSSPSPVGCGGFETAHLDLPQRAGRPGSNLDPKHAVPRKCLSAATTATRSLRTLPCVTLRGFDDRLLAHHQQPPEPQAPTIRSASIR